MANNITHLPDLDKYIKRLNYYLQEHYPANKKISAEEWNALFLALMHQGNLQEETLEKICNSYLPLQINKINELAVLANNHEARISGLRSDTDLVLQQYRNTLSIAEEAKTISASAKDVADESLVFAKNAFNSSEEAVNAATEATDVATRALNESESAVATSQNALEVAQTAERQSSEAVNVSNNALEVSEDAFATANAAKDTSTNALATSQQANANSLAAVNTATTANTNSLEAKRYAKNALDLVTEGMGSQVLVNGEAVSVFDADTKADVTYVNQKIDDIMGPGSTEAIDTVLELADAFKNNSDVIKVLNEAISTKANASALDDYLPLTAGGGKPLTGDLVLNNDLLRGIYFKSLTQQNSSLGDCGIEAYENNMLTVTATGGIIFRNDYGDNYVTIENNTLYQNGKQVANKEDLNNYVTIDTTEQTISGTKKFTANNNTFTRTLVLGANTPINFTGIGAGTYNIGAFVCNTTDKFGVECPRETDSASAAIIPFRIGARGGQLGILQAGDIYQNGKPVANADDLSAVTDATLSDDNKTLTITKRNGTSFDFQGGSDLTKDLAVREFATLVPSGTRITDNANLNTVDYLKVGNYACTSDASAKTIVNSPTPFTFMMQVICPNLDTYDDETTTPWRYRLRIITDRLGNVYYQSSNSAGTAGVFVYGAWKQVINSSGGRIDGRLTVDDPNTDTAISVIGSAYGAYINYLNTDGTVLGYIGCNSSKRASFYNGTYYTLAYTTEIPKLGTTNWNVAQDSSGNLVFSYA
jgi:hypothetical protein